MNNDEQQGQSLNWGHMALVVLLGSASLWLGTQTSFTIADVLHWQAALSTEFEASPVLFSVIYFLGFTALTALCLPGASLLMLAGGGCMGFATCCVLSTAASAAGAVLTMLAARHLLRQRLEGKYPKQLDTLNRGLAKSPVNYMLSLRLAPIIPFVLFNLLAGVTRLPASTFLWTSFVGMLPGTALYVYAGSQAQNARTLHDLVTVEMGVAVAALALVPWLLKFLFQPSVQNGH